MIWYILLRIMTRYDPFSRDSGFDRGRNEWVFFKPSSASSASSASAGAYAETGTLAVVQVERTCLIPVPCPRVGFETKQYRACITVLLCNVYDSYSLNVGTEYKHANDQFIFCSTNRCTRCVYWTIWAGMYNIGTYNPKIATTFVTASSVAVR